MFVYLDQHLKSKNIEMKIANIPEEIMKVFEMGFFDKFFTII